MKKVILGFVYIVAVFLFANYAIANTKTNFTAGKNLIQTVSKGELKVLSSFKAVAGMDGFVVEPKFKANRKMIMFTDAAGKYLFVGNIISAAGQNITEKYTQEFITSLVAKQAYPELANLTWFTEGSNKAPHKVYIVLDPNCIFCHKEYGLLQPMIAKGEVQVRWVTVGFLKPTSLGKAARILSGSTTKDKIAFLRKDERAFRENIEEGGVQPLKPNANLVNAAAFSNARRNTAFFTKYASTFIGTPVILYKSQAGIPQVFLGYANQNQLPQVVAKMGSNW